MRIIHAQQHNVLTFTTLVGIVFVALFALIRVTDAAPNYQINYQGKLTNAANVAVADGTYNMRFWLLTSQSIATTSAVWTESLTGTSKVQVTNGLFSVMLGSTTPLTGVDFNQTLYLGVEIGGTSTPAWDGEMSPRKVLGAVPAAFEANKLDGLDSTQFVRTDATSTIATSSANTLLTLTQNGVGDIFNLFDGTTEVFTVTDGGRMGLGTTSPSRLFTMQGGDFWLGGNMTATGTITSATLTVSASSTLGYASSTALTVSGNGFINALTLTGSSAGVLTTNTSGVVSASTTIGDAYISDSLTLTTSTGLPISTGVSGLGTNVATFLATPSSANLASALTDETGTGNAVFSASPTFTGGATFSGINVSATSTLGYASSTALTVTNNAYLNTYTASNGTTTNATSTTFRTATLGIGSEYITDITGSGLSITNGVLNASGLSNWTDQGTYLTPLTATDGISLSGSSTAQYLTMINSTTTNATTTNLRVSGTSALGTVAAGTWNGTAIGLAYGGTGADTSAYSSGLLGLTTGTMTDVDSEAEFETIMGSDYLTVTASDITSANLATILSDETGTGSVVFSDSPTFTGSAQFAGLRVTASSTLGYASSTALTVSGTSYLNFASSTNASTTGLTAQNAYLSALTLGTTAGVLTTNTSGVVSASSTIGDSYITDALTVSGGTIGSNNISGTLTTTGTLTIGDNGDVINIDSSTWDVTSGAFTGITNLSVTGSSTIGGGTGTTGLTINGNATTTGNSYIAGNVSIGTTSASAHLTIDASGLTGSIVGGMKQYLGFINSTLSALYYGDETYITNVPTATSTLVGKMIRIADTSALGNTIRGLEVQAHRGTNTKGENTGLSGFGRTFGVRGSTMGDAGDTYLPAGMFAETEGTTQGNALRAYSGTITSENLVYFFQDTSNFTGTGLKMDFGNAGGSFAATSTAKFLDFKVNGTSKFYVSANGSTTIGDGTVSASLRIPYGGICVDNDGSCVSTTTGQIRSVTSALGNSDLAEMYFSNQSLRTGEIVSLAGGLSVKRANSDTEENIIGVVSTKPGMTLGFDDSSLAQGETGYPVGLKGRVPVRLSIENGVIHKGDRIALSSISGVGMKAHEGDRIVGIALEDFDGTKAYSAGFLNQFGDDMVKEQMVAVREIDVRAQDGCYNGGGNALGEAECEERTETPLTLPSVNPEKTRAEMLAELRNTGPESATGENGETYAVGQAIMFIELAWYQDSAERMVLSELATTTPLEGGGTTLWDRIKTLATNFVDGVLSVTGIKADRVEVKDELCVDGVCVTADDLRAILESTRGGAGTGGGATGGDETGGGEVTGGVETPVEPNPPTLPEPTSTPTEEPPVVEEPTPEAPTEPEAPQEPAPQPEPSPAPSEPTV